MKRTLTYIIIALLTFVTLAFGSPTHAQDNGLPAGVVGTEWKLIQVQRSAQEVLSVEDANITLTFDGKGLAGGNSACNSYSTAYQTGPGNALTFDDIVSTLRACVDTRLMDLETEYYRALDGVASYTFSGSVLQLFYNGGSMLEFSTAMSTIPGMPKTGAISADYLLPVVLGLALAAFVMGSLVWSRCRRQSRV